MTFSIDDVREGDVVTYEQGKQGQAGYICRSVRVVGDRRIPGLDPDEVRAYDLAERVELGFVRIISVARNAPMPTGAGSMVFTDTGVAFRGSNEPGDKPWRVAYQTPTGRDLQRFNDDQMPNPVEALPVPAEPLRALLAAWDEMSDYKQRALGSSTPAPRVAVRTKVAAFIESTRAEWERAGITP